MSAILEIKNLNKHFGGIHVANNINMSIKKGEMSAIIGPNGAGKTTLFNLITGFIPSDDGKVFFEGQDITNTRPETIVKLGIIRAFQVASVFLEETVYDNIYLASLAHFNKSAKIFADRMIFKDVHEHTEFILKKLGLFDCKDLKASELSHGDMKALDIAIALTLQPKILLLDEPTAGMAPEERFKMMHLIKELHDYFKLTLVFIEHDMDIVFSIAQTIRVLVQGQLIAEGNPDYIRQHEGVIEAYLGKEVF
ncbi:MAG: ABC transporter ATP-binding protein [Candidatus Goldbacteria bacterium]|nr:ABC transporter ATP-binding protein [Candidatus Goldiibacteriota bacterium]